MANILKGQNLSATTTAKNLALGDATVAHTLKNDGAGILFYRSLAEPDATTATGTGAELRVLDYSELKVGENVILPPSGRLVQYVCGSDTGTTATARLIAGEMVGAVKAYGTGAPATANITGTSAALGAQACRTVVLTANPANTGLLWIGIGATAVIGSGIPLAAGDRIKVAVSNTNMVNAIAATSGDDLCYQWVN